MPLGKRKSKKRAPKVVSKAKTGTASARVVTEKKADGDNVDTFVEEFLRECGLSEENLAGVLKKMGLTSEARITALGQLSDAVLEKLEKSLEDQEVDFTARLLVFAGLKRRAAAVAAAD